VCRRVLNIKRIEQFEQDALEAAKQYEQLLLEKGTKTTLNERVREIELASGN